MPSVGQKPDDAVAEYAMALAGHRENDQDLVRVANARARQQQQPLVHFLQIIIIKKFNISRSYLKQIVIRQWAGYLSRLYYSS
jgi:hypothetical protein